MFNDRKFLWLTDTHFNLASLWSRWKFARCMDAESPCGVFLSGDITTGSRLTQDLYWLARHIDCPIYFVLGNHDYWGKSIAESHAELRDLCAEAPNLIWLTDKGPVQLSEDIAVIGAEGWYDAAYGNPWWVRFTADWFMVEDFRRLPGHEARLSAFQRLAAESAECVADKLAAALGSYKTVYLVTHFPPWVEATRDVGTFMEQFWLPYNVNAVLGRRLEAVMRHRKKRRLVVLSGHTHVPNLIQVSRNIQCFVGEASYTRPVKHYQRIYVR